MSIERATRALIALEAIQKLMDLYQEYEEEEPRPKRRKMLDKYEDIESQILKEVTWISGDAKDAFIPISMDYFEDIFTLLKSKVDNVGKFIISYRMRLAITLRYLIKGDSCRTLEKICHISRKSISKIVRHMLGLLIHMMKEDHLKLPSTQSQWSSIVHDFEKFWQFPHTLGVLDAKHFRVNLTSNPLSCRSFVLLSIIDAYGRFLYAETIECDEETEESTVYANSNLYKLLKNNTLNIPTKKPLKGRNTKTDYYFIGTDVFVQDRYVLKEYNECFDLNKHQKAFNYRLSRVRVVEEVVFKALFYRFKILGRLVHLDKKIASSIIKACCILHNFFTQTLDEPFGNNMDMNAVSTPNIALPLAIQFVEKYEKSCQRRENLCNYFVTHVDLTEQ